MNIWTINSDSIQIDRSSVIIHSKAVDFKPSRWGMKYILRRATANQYVIAEERKKTVMSFNLVTTGWGSVLNRETN